MTRVTRLNPFVSVADRPLRRPSRNTVTIIGDSIAEAGSQAFQYAPLMGDMYMNHLCVESFQRMRFAGQYAVKGGYSLSNIQSTLLPVVLAANPLPGACIVAGGTNDVANINGPSGLFSLSNSSGILKSIAASLLTVGIVPILTTVPPHTENQTFNPNVVKWNQWIRRYASTNGFPLIDMYTAVTGSDGNYISASYTTDNLHPSAIGHRAIALQALADGLTDIFPPAGTVLTSRSTADLSTMLNNGTINQGLFTVDTNADGVADGLTITGTATASIVAPVAADNLIGNWQQLARTTGNTGSASVRKTAFSTGWSVGDVIAFSARVQTENINTTQTPFSVRLMHNIPGGLLTGGVTITQAYHGIEKWKSDIDDGLIYVEAPVPVGATDMGVYINMDAVANAGTPKVRVGELTIVNLTTGGLLV